MPLILEMAGIALHAKSRKVITRVIGFADIIWYERLNPSTVSLLVGLFILVCNVIVMLDKLSVNASILL